MTSRRSLPNYVGGRFAEFMAFMAFMGQLELANEGYQTKKSPAVVDRLSVFLTAEKPFNLITYGLMYVYYIAV